MIRCPIGCEGHGMHIDIDAHRALVSPVRVTTFLTFWSFEEYWHGAAIRRLLAA